MPELQHNLAALGMHGVGNLLPALHLFGGPDARGVRVADAHGRHRGGFADDQAGAGALAVVLDHKLTGHAARFCAAAGQGRHDDAIGQFQVADLDGVEECGHEGAALVATAAGVFSKAINFVPVFISIYGTLAFPLMGFIAVGGMLAYILPNLPMLIWFGIIIGWTVMVVEAIIAAPLWAVMHLHPNGDDVSGKGSPGYMLVLGLVLRPALIVFGLIAAIIFSELFGQLLNRIFFDVFSANNSNATLGFFAVIFGTALYATLMFHIIKNTFALMHKIPDQLLRWIGGGQESLGSYANEVGAGTMAQNAAVTGAAMTYMGTQAIQGIGGAAQTGSNLHKQRQEEKKQKEAEEKQKAGGDGAAFGFGEAGGGDEGFKKK